MPWWRKPFTVILVPHDGSDTRTLSIHWLALLGGILGLVLLLTSLLVVAGLTLPIPLAGLSSPDDPSGQQLARLRAQNREYRKLQNTVESLREQLRKSRKLHRSIMRISGFSNYELPANRMGGLPSSRAPSEDTLNATRATLKQQLDQNRQLTKIRKFVKSRNKVFQHTPMLWPVEGWLSSPFGVRKDPMGGQGKSFHDGVDIAAWHGSPVRAPADARVVFSGVKGGYGKMIRLRHEYGYTTLFAHLSQRLVDSGESVQKGQVIGRVGSTGHSTGSHVHYEVRVNREAINPWPYLVQQYDSFKKFTSHGGKP